MSCYRIQGQNVNKPLNLKHLNPLLATLPNRNVTITYPQHLCVPVRKNNQLIPADVFNIVRYIDLEMFDIATPALVPPVNLGNNHINPDLIGLPTEAVTIYQGIQLGLPMAKNGLIPPG